METNQSPMNEYEGALYEVVRVLLQTVLDMGADRTMLLTRLQPMAEAARKIGRKDGATTIDMLIRSVVSATTYCASEPN